MGQQKSIVSGEAWDALPDAPTNAAQPKATAAAADGAGSADSGGGVLRGLADLGIGATKGAASTMEHLFHVTPTGPDDPLTAKPMVHWGADGTKPSNPMQAAGHAGEQIGEFLIPAGMAREAAIKGLVSLIPDAASPGVMKVLNKAGAYIGRTVGEMASAGSVASAHGDSDVGREMAIAGAGPALSGALGAAINNPIVQRILANTGGGVSAGVMPGGLGSKMGTFGIVKDLIEKYLQGGGGSAIAKRVPYLTRAAAGASSTTETEHR